MRIYQVHLLRADNGSKGYSFHVNKRHVFRASRMPATAFLLAWEGGDLAERLMALAMRLASRRDRQKTRAQ